MFLESGTLVKGEESSESDMNKKSDFSKYKQRQSFHKLSRFSEAPEAVVSGHLLVCSVISFSVFFFTWDFTSLSTLYKSYYKG